MRNVSFQFQTEFPRPKLHKDDQLERTPRRFLASAVRVSRALSAISPTPPSSSAFHPNPVHSSTRPQPRQFRNRTRIRASHSLAPGLRLESLSTAAQPRLLFDNWGRTGFDRACEVWCGASRRTLAALKSVHTNNCQHAVRSRGLIDRDDRRLTPDGVAVADIGLVFARRLGARDEKTLRLGNARAVAGLTNAETSYSDYTRRGATLTVTGRGFDSPRLHF